MVPNKFISRISLVLITCLILAFAFFSVVSASETPPGLTMEAQAAYDGHFKFGEWLPVWVHLENTGADLEAEVQISILQGRGLQTFALPVQLPSGSRKRVPLYVLPNSYSHELMAKLVVNNEVLLSQKIPVNPNANITYLVGLITPERGALALLGGVSLPQGRVHKLVDISLDELPGRVEGLLSFDCLILNNVDTSTLTAEQKTTLLSWVQEGGRLVIGGGSGALRTTANLPQVLLPINPQELVEIDDLTALAEYAEGGEIRVPGPFVAALGEQIGGHALVSQDNLPLVNERAIGQGVVDYVALDLTVSPFDAWSGTAAFWEKLISPGAEYPQWLPADISVQQMQSGQMVYALSNLPSLDLPSIRGLGILLVLYVILVGPVNYLVLRKRKRLQWAWLTIPAITVAFTMGTFGLSYLLRGTDLILNKIALIELGTGGTAKVSSYLGLFSPAQQSYEVEVMGNGLLSPLSADYYDPWSSRNSNAYATSEVTFLQGNPGRVRGLSVNQWSMQTFKTEDVWSDFGSVDAELRLKNDELSGEVHNGTEYTLEDAVLIFANDFVRLGDLSPGERAQVSLGLSNPIDKRLGPPMSYFLLEDEFMRSGPTGPSREAELKRAVLDSLFQPEYSPISSRLPAPHLSGETNTFQGPLLIAWLAEAPPDVRVEGRTPAQKTTALLYTRFSYKVEGDQGRFSLPTGLIPGKMVDWPTEGGECDPSTSSVWIERGQAVFEFQIPETVQGLDVDVLKIGIDTDGGMWQSPDTAVYNWNDGVWRRLKNVTMGINILTDTEGLISEDGLVRVSLSADNNRGGGCIFLSLGLEGTHD